MTEQNTRDALFEALFRQAVIDNYEEEIAEGLDEGDGLKLHIFSERHNLRMKKLFAQAEGRERLQYGIKWAGRCVAAVLVGTLVFFSALMTVPEVRAAVKSVVIEWFDQFTKFSSDESAPKEVQNWAPSYIPEEFYEDERYDDFGHVTIRYSNTNGDIIRFSYIDQSGSISVDNESRKFYEVVNGEIIYYVFEAEASNKGNSVIWDQDGYRFTVKGQSSIDNLLNMAKSIKLQIKK